MGINLIPGSLLLAATTCASKGGNTADKGLIKSSDKFCVSAAQAKVLINTFPYRVKLFSPAKSWACYFLIFLFCEAVAAKARNF